MRKISALSALKNRYCRVQHPVRSRFFEPKFHAELSYTSRQGKPQERIDILQGFGWRDNEARGTSVRKDGAFQLIQFQQNPFHGKSILACIVRKVIFQVRPDDQRNKGAKELARRRFVRMRMQPLHVCLVFQVVKALLHNIPPAVDAQNLRRRFGEVCLRNQKVSAPRQRLVNCPVVASEAETSVLRAVDEEISVILLCIGIYDDCYNFFFYLSIKI